MAPSRKQTKSPPKTVIGRSSRLLTLAAGLAAKEVAGRIERAVARGEELQKSIQRVRRQVEQARQIVESLGRLKGAAMKAGQMITLELRDYLPPEVLDVLRELQDGAHFVSYDEIESILKKELGPAKLARLNSISREPIASASIGQVHAAKIAGDEGAETSIVLKVQFRGISDTIDSDLALLEKIVRGLLAVSLRDIDFGEVLSEVKEVLKQETDYRREASYLERYRALAAEIPGVVVPRVYEEFSTSRVLALSHEAGVSPEDWMKTNPDRAQRDRFAGLFLDLYFREFFDWGFVQTDPNFGNFLIRADQNELVCLDFGATKEYPAEFRRTYRELLLACSSDDYGRTLQVAHALKLIDPRESDESKRLLYQVMREVLAMFRPENQPFDFGDRDFVDRTRATLIKMMRGLRHSPPPKDLIFLHRKLGGIYSLLKALDVRADLTPYWDRMVATPIR
jgi:aarF domain-containing kinase